MTRSQETAALLAGWLALLVLWSQVGEAEFGSILSLLAYPFVFWVGYRIGKTKIDK